MIDLAMDMEGARRQTLVEGLTTTLLALLLDVDLHHPRNATPALDQAQFGETVRFATARLGRHLDLAEWAGAVGLSASDFARRFQHHTGVAPYTWFMDRRIDEAKLLMTRRRMPLAEVAPESGFCSQSRFTEAFRRRVGMSPGHWWEAHVQKSDHGSDAFVRWGELAGRRSGLRSRVRQAGTPRH